MEHISPDLWDDPRFVLYAVQRAPGALEHAQADIKVRCWGSLDINRVVWRGEDKLDWQTHYKCQVWIGMTSSQQISHCHNYLDYDQPKNAVKFAMQNQPGKSWQIYVNLHRYHEGFQTIFMMFYVKLVPGRAS